MLATVDKLEARIKEIEAGVCDDCKKKLFLEKPEEPKAELKCPECDFVAVGKSEGTAKNNLRLHSKKHNQKAA